MTEDKHIGSTLRSLFEELGETEALARCTCGVLCSEHYAGEDNCATCPRTCSILHARIRANREAASYPVTSEEAYAQQAAALRGETAPPMTDEQRANIPRLAKLYPMVALHRARPKT